MATDGEIRQLYADAAKTKPIYPKTSTKAVYDANGLGIEARLEETDNKINKLKYVLAIISPSKWSDTAPYTYTIDIPGMTEDWQPGVPWHNLWEDLYTNHMSELITRLQELAKIKIIRSNNGSLTFIAPEEKPTCWLDICVPGESYSGNAGRDNA